MQTVEERILSWSHGEPSHQNRGTKLLTRQGGRTDCQRRKKQGRMEKGSFSKGSFSSTQGSHH